MSTTALNRLTAELSQQWHSFMKQLAGLRKRLDFARDHYYLTQECEPVLELIKPGIAWVAEGRYGPTLISRDLPIWDVDHWGGDPDRTSLDRLRSALDSTPEAEGRCFRVYSTFGGVRVIATEPAPDAGDLSPFEGDWFKTIGAALNADPAYMAISTRQKCSRARLKHKPPEHRTSCTGAPMALFRPDCVRACRFISSIGTGELHPDLQAQINFHDAETEALDSDKELF